MNNSLYQQPKLYKKLSNELETLAHAIVASGRMRIITDKGCNFTRLLLLEEMTAFTLTIRELENTDLLAKARQRLIQKMTKHAAEETESTATDFIERAKENLQKATPIAAEIELMFARALVQSNSFPVIELVHKEQVEIFIAAGQTNEDDIGTSNWAEYGKDSPEQTFNPGVCAIHITCRGNPFPLKGEHILKNDGKLAVARFMQGAAVETAHIANMIRNEKGHWMGRHSANNWCESGAEHIATLRRRDIANCDAFMRKLEDIGIDRMIKWETAQENNKYKSALRRFIIRIRSQLAWHSFKTLMKNRGMRALTNLPNTSYPASQLYAILGHMMDNLDPQYINQQTEDVKEREMLACMEALVRLPKQQLIWGEEIVYYCCPSIYSYYYNVMEPACEQATQRIIKYDL